MQFFVYLNGAERGPLSEEQVQALLADGVLLGSDLGSEQPGGAWKALSAFRRFSSVDTEPLSESASPRPLPATAGELSPDPAAPPQLRPPQHAPLPPAPSHVAPESLGSYSRSTLAPNETAFYKTSLHWIVFVRFAVIAALVFLFVALPFAIAVQALAGTELGWFALPLPAFIMLPPTLAFASSELVVTDKRVLIKTGIIQRQTLELFVSKIESVGVDQGFVGRLLDYGTVTIRGTGGSAEPFDAIARPLEFRNAVQRLQSDATTLR